MVTIEMMLLVLVIGWIFSVAYGWTVGARHHDGLGGALLGLLFGPLGIIAAGHLDQRPQCRNCGGRLNGNRQAPFPVCQHCGFKLRPLSHESPHVRTVDEHATAELDATNASPGETGTKELEALNAWPADDKWADELEAAKHRLTLAGLIRGE